MKRWATTSGFLLKPFLFHQPPSSPPPRRPGGKAGHGHQTAKSPSRPADTAVLQKMAWALQRMGSPGTLLIFPWEAGGARASGAEAPARPPWPHPGPQRWNQESDSGLWARPGTRGSTGCWGPLRAGWPGSGTLCAFPQDVARHQLRCQVPQLSAQVAKLPPRQGALGSWVQSHTAPAPRPEVWLRTAAGSTGPAEGEAGHGEKGAQGTRLRERQRLVPGTRLLGLLCLIPQKGCDCPPAKAVGPRGPRLAARTSTLVRSRAGDTHALHCSKHGPNSPNSKRHRRHAWPWDEGHRAGGAAPTPVGSSRTGPSDPQGDAAGPATGTLPAARSHTSVAVVVVTVTAVICKAQGRRRLRSAVGPGARCPAPPHSAPEAPVPALWASDARPPTRGTPLWSRRCRSWGPAAWHVVSAQDHSPLAGPPSGLARCPWPPEWAPNPRGRSTKRPLRSAAALRGPAEPHRCRPPSAGR